jgi:hypothetical protein
LTLDDDASLLIGADLPAAIALSLRRLRLGAAGGGDRRRGQRRK